jgi:SOS-response transcriptional repressor LexA
LRRPGKFGSHEAAPCADGMPPAPMTQHTTPARRIPIHAAPADDGCSGSESFALMVLGDSMAPEFAHGDIVIEPDGLAADGSFVLALCGDEWIFRQLRRRGDGWHLQALNPAYAGVDLPDLSAVHGVIIQKSRPGRRRASKRYVD